MERYCRQILLPEIGVEGQKLLAKKSVLMVGLGGLGCPVGLYLTGAGIGRIGLCDKDVVSLHNLHRQTLYSEAEVGRPKIEAARQRLSTLNSGTTFDLWPDGLTRQNSENIISRYDLVIDCCDNFATRFLIDDTCLKVGKPWVYGSIGGWQGQVGLFLPDNKVRYSDLFSDREEMESQPAASGGVIGFVPGVTGAIEVAEAIKYLLNLPDTLEGKILSFNLKTYQFNKITL